MKIKKVALGLPPIDCEDLEIRVIYSVGAESAESFWEAKSIDGITVQNGNVTIPNEVLIVWNGDSDEVIENYILEVLKLEKI